MFLMFIIPVHAAIPSIIGSNLIDQTCKQTPYYDLCIGCLISNPHSFKTDVRGLAKIMVYTIEAKANHTLHRIQKLLKHRQEPKEQEALRSCAERYSAIIKGDIPQSIEALRTGHYKFAEQGTYDAAAEAISCEEGFTGKSPLADSNIIVHHVSVVAASIVKLLL